jgi:Ca-activated chloride channel family protein
MFRLATPYALLLLALIPLLVGYRHRRRPPAMAVAETRVAAELTSSPALRLHWLLPGLYYLMLVLLIAALARPQWGTERLPTETEGINIVLTVDLSGSMAAEDFNYQGRRLNRLEAIKTVVRDFIARRAGDRIGMVVFGSQAYTQLPLTRDYQTIGAILERLAIGAAGRNTAIGDAIGISVKRLADIESRSNIIILLTDGRSNAGELEPMAAAQIAGQKQIKIYTIGVGGKGRAPVPIDDPIFGRRYVYQQDDLDETGLKAIAEKTGGLFFRAEDLESLQKIYGTIDSMEKNKVEVQGFAEYRELYFYLLPPALLLLAAWIVLKHTRFLEIP